MLLSHAAFPRWKQTAVSDTLGVISCSCNHLIMWLSRGILEVPRQNRHRPIGETRWGGRIYADGRVSLATSHTWRHALIWLSGFDASFHMVATALVCCTEYSYGDEIILKSEGYELSPTMLSLFPCLPTTLWKIEVLPCFIFNYSF